jgi:hypothetical protein
MGVQTKLNIGNLLLVSMYVRCGEGCISCLSKVKIMKGYNDIKCLVTRLTGFSLTAHSFSVARLISQSNGVYVRNLTK